MATKDKIFPSDTYPIKLECRQPDPLNPDDSLGLPITPLSAKATLMDSATGAFLPIGGTGVFQQNASITAATGSTRDHTGGIISYTVAATWTAEPKDLVLFIQATFAGGYVLTENRNIKILEFR
jgi:hypothetical protein